MDKELIENIANALAVSEICPFAHEDCIDNCHKHFSNWLDNHDKQIREKEKEEIKELLKAIMYVLDDYSTRLGDYSKVIEEQLKEQKNETK